MKNKLPFEIPEDLKQLLKNKRNQVQLIDYFPAGLNLKHIKGPLYEAYIIMSEESILLQHNMMQDYIRYSIADWGSRGYFVKRIYTKYHVMSTGATIFGIELVKLRDTKVELI